MVEITCEMLANPFWSVLYERYYCHRSKDFQLDGQTGDIILILRIMADHVDVSDFRPPQNAYRYVLDKLKRYGRFEILERLRADWNRAASQ